MARKGRQRIHWSPAVFKTEYPALAEVHYPPDMNPVYVKTWMALINPILERKTFNSAHLMALQTICELYVELDKLTAHVKLHGATYESTHTKTGVTTIRERPENLARDRLLRSISRHMKLLGLFPSVSDVVGIKPPPKDTSKDEWEV